MNKFTLEIEVFWTSEFLELLYMLEWGARNLNCFKIKLDGFVSMTGQ